MGGCGGGVVHACNPSTRVTASWEPAWGTQ